MQCSDYYVFWFTDEESKFLLTAVIISATSMLATLCIVIFALFIRKNLREKAKAKKEVTQDQNPIYGQYYFPDGVKIDDATVEVEDHNDLYEEKYDDFDDWVTRCNKLDFGGAIDESLVYK